MRWLKGKAHNRSRFFAARALDASVSGKAGLSPILAANGRLLAAMRSAWVLQRSNAWFRLAMDPDRMSNQRFRKHFRVTREFFLWLKNELKPLIKRQRTHMRAPIKAKKKVAVTLYRLAHGTGFRQLSEIFAMGESTAQETFLEVCKAIRDKFHQVLSWQDGAAAEENKKWYAMKGLPGCVGAVDGTHFQVQPSHAHAHHQRMQGGQA